MAEDYLTDDEQLEHVKRLFAEYGPWVIGAVILGLGLAFGYRYYLSHLNQRALEASAQFADMNSAVQRNDDAKARQLAGELVKAHPTSPYADQAQLVLARLAVDEGQDAGAVGPLQVVIASSKDSELKHIARLRLARIQIDQGKPDEALKTLSDPPGSFAARYDEVRGDAYYAKKDLAKASQAYKSALGQGAGENMDSALLALKIADLGLPDAAAPPAPPPSGAPAPVSPPSASATPTPAAPSSPPSSNKAKP
jgi:predicted negative regulator of RcsB-dependent stress response